MSIEITLDLATQEVEVSQNIPEVEIGQSIPVGVLGLPGPTGPKGDPGPDTSELISEHIASELPHPVYDDGPSLTLLYENAKV